MSRPVKKLYIEYFNDIVRDGALDYRESFYSSLEKGYYGFFETRKELRDELYGISKDDMENYRNLLSQTFELWEEHGSQVLMFDADAERQIGGTDGNDTLTEREVCDAFPYEVAYLAFNNNQYYDGAFIVIVDGHLLDVEIPRIDAICKRNGIKGGVGNPSQFNDSSPDRDRYLMNLCMYIAAINADINVVYRPPKDKRALRNPKKRRSSATVTEVGYRIGSALREHERSASHGHEGTGVTVRPHVRRAHWHRFWTGPMDGERKLVTKWLHPVLVGTGEIQTTLHEVP